MELKEQYVRKFIMGTRSLVFNSGIKIDWGKEKYMDLYNKREKIELVWWSMSRWKLSNK